MMIAMVLAAVAMMLLIILILMCVTMLIVQKRCRVEGERAMERGHAFVAVYRERHNAELTKLGCDP